MFKKFTTSDKLLFIAAILSLKNDISIPCFGEALNYFNSISSNSLSTKMIQAQRNFFGSHDIKIN